MCKQCGHDPYLAGLLVVFEMPPFSVDVDGHDVETEDRPQGYIGRCAQHHRGKVMIRTKAKDYRLSDDRVIATVVAS